jgi:hypothetical protein
MKGTNIVGGGVWCGRAPPPAAFDVDLTFDESVVLRPCHSEASRRRARNPLLHAAPQLMWRQPSRPSKERSDAPCKSMYLALTTPDCQSRSPLLVAFPSPHDFPADISALA